MRIRRFAHATLVVALLLGSASDIEAQGTIRGVLFDSLRVLEPVRGSEVVLRGTARRAVTDREGRFEFTDVPAGAHVVAFHAPWLDSIGLPALERRIDVGASSRPAQIVLAPPSLAEYQLRVCGTRLPDDQGVLLGEVWGRDGLPRERYPVAARWTETVIAPGIVSRRELATVDTTSASGMFVLCGVPRDADVVVASAASSGDHGGEVIIGLAGDAIRRRDLVLGDPGATVRVRGRTLDADGRPLAGATVTVIGDSSISAQTGADGTFSFAAFPQRSAQLLVRTVGFQPRVVELDPLGESVELADLRMSRVPYELTRVTVEGRVLTREERDYEQRRSTGLGTFVTEEQIRKYPVFGAVQLYQHTPRSHVKCFPGGCDYYLTRGNLACRPRVFLDGSDQGAEFELLDRFLQVAKRVEVYRAAAAPPRFADFDGCGALVIWTR